MPKLISRRAPAQPALSYEDQMAKDFADGTKSMKQLMQENQELAYCDGEDPTGKHFKAMIERNAAKFGWKRPKSTGRLAWENASSEEERDAIARRNFERVARRRNPKFSLDLH